MDAKKLKKEAERRLKPPKAFWDWCYSQIRTYKWSNKQETIVASERPLGHCVEKRLTKSSKLTFYDKTYFFSIVLVTAKRIEIQSYMFNSRLENGKQIVEHRLTNLERFENDQHIKIGHYRDRYMPYLIENFYGGGPYSGNKLYPSDWKKRLLEISELKYIQIPSVERWEIERLYKYRFEIEFAQKINAQELARNIMYPDYISTRSGWRKSVDMRTLNRSWLQRNKQFFKNSDRDFLDFELERRIKERNGKMVYGISNYLSFHDIAKVPKNIGINKFQNWVIKYKINFKEYQDYLAMLREMGIEPEGDAMIVPKDFEGMHRHTVELYNQFREEERRLADEKRQQERREREKKLEAEFKARPSFDKVISGYSFHVPIRVAELIYEGKKLHHCVANYTSRHFRGDTMIVFMRTEDKPNTPLYTLEVAAGRIVQLRGKYNNKAPDQVWKIAEEWLMQVNKQKRVA